jgi:hypothetical protein
MMAVGGFFVKRDSLLAGEVESRRSNYGSIDPDLDGRLATGEIAP